MNFEISAAEVAEALRGGKTKLIDVRTEEEYAVARIVGAQLITQELVEEMKSWPKDTPIVFHCHRGFRSLDAATFFAAQGFTNVKSMTGGIDAWSQLVDPSVPRY